MPSRAEMLQIFTPKPGSKPTRMSPVQTRVPIDRDREITRRIPNKTTRPAGSREYKLEEDRKPQPKPTQDYLDTIEDEVIARLYNGESIGELSRRYKFGLSAWYGWMHQTTERVARVTAAMKHSSHAYADKAEQVLKRAKANKIEIQRARELAHHYRWMARVREPKIYGDKLELDAKVETTPDKVTGELLTALTNLQTLSRKKARKNDNSET